MKNTKISILTVAVLFILTFTFYACEEDSLTGADSQVALDLRNGGDVNADCDLVDPAASLTEAEEEMILFMREEEKLARDVYLTLADLYDLSIFTNIAKSEQTHMDRILCLIDFYELEDPVIEEIGQFNDQELLTLFNVLVEQGSESIVQALTVGATIEDLDIKDLDESLSQSENPALLNIFENLLCGSYNHLTAFVKMLEMENASYSPQYIDAEMYEAILAGEYADCNGSKGNNDGNGKKGKKGNNGNDGNGDGECDNDGSGNGNGDGECDNGNDGKGNKGGNGGNGDGDGECDNDGSGNGDGGNDGGNGNNGDGGNNGGNGDGNGGNDGDGGNGGN